MMHVPGISFGWCSGRLPSLAILFLCIITLLNACGSGDGSGTGDNTGEEVTAPAANPTYTLSGTITAPSGAAVDWDVGDANTSQPEYSNNTLTATQPLTAPVKLAGNLDTDGDGSDFFAVTLTPGQAIILYTADATDAELDLYLYSQAGEMIDSAMGEGVLEALEIATAGSYIIEVRISGTLANSNYYLYVGIDSEVSIAAGALRLSDGFVPGEIILRFTEEAVSATDTAWAAQRRATKYPRRSRPPAMRG